MKKDHKINFTDKDLDILVCENFVLYKNKQKAQLKKDYKNKFIISSCSG